MHAHGPSYGTFNATMGLLTRTNRQDAPVNAAFCSVPTVSFGACTHPKSVGQALGRAGPIEDGELRDRRAVKYFKGTRFHWESLGRQIVKGRVT